jgi:hypothetical protein
MAAYLIRSISPSNGGGWSSTAGATQQYGAEEQSRGITNAYHDKSDRQIAATGTAAGRGHHRPRARPASSAA